MIFAYKVLFIIATLVVAVVATVASLTDVQPTTRLFWIGAFLGCFCQIGSWIKKNKNENTDIDNGTGRLGDGSGLWTQSDG